MPCSIIVLASGGFAASGDLNLQHVLIVSFLAYMIGDQLAYFIARHFGVSFIDGLKEKRKFAPVVQRSERLINRYGTFAVFLSHTLISPTGPYVSYICGASQMKWALFSVFAGLGAIIWSTSYSFLGYLFAEKLPLISNLLSSLIVITLAIISMLVFAIWLRHSWKNRQKV